MRSFLIAVCSAVSASAAVDANGCVTDYNAQTNYYPSAAQLTIGMEDGHYLASLTAGATASIVFANLFQVDYYPTYKVAHLNYTIQAMGAFNGQNVPALVLWQCGTPQPTPGTSPGVPSDARLFRTPLSSVAVPGTVPLTYMHLLGLLNKISIIDGTYASTPCIQKAVDCGVLTHAASSSAAWTTAVGSADAVITDMWLTGGATNSAKDIPMAATADMGPLHRAEWIKFVSLFFNREVEANSIFQAIHADYNAIKARAMVHGNSMAGGPPVVAWIDYSSWGTPSWSISGAQYKRGYVQDAGGATRVVPSPVAGCSANADNTKYTCQSAAALKEALKGVDMVIDESYEYDPAAHGITDFLTKFGIVEADKTNSDYPFLVNNKVYRLDLTHSDAHSSGNKGLAWFETAVPFPNRVLSDIVRALYGEDKTVCEREYLRHMNLNGHQSTSEEGHSLCGLACAATATDRASPAICGPAPVSSAASLAPLLAVAIAGAAAALI